MATKKTYKDQITTSKGKRLQRTRQKIRALGLTEKSTDEALQWARRRKTDKN